MKTEHRGVAYVVNSTDGIKWNWKAYPKISEVSGSPIKGEIDGSESDAVAACIAAIDEAFDGKSN